MKSFSFVFLFFCMACSLSAKELKVLMIGNSFSGSVMGQLPPIVRTEKKHKLTIAQMMIGGCTLARHMDELKKAEADPNYKPYSTNFPKRGKTNLPEMIKAEKWDIVTIQQASHESWQEKRFYPFADDLIAYIRKNAPQSEIVVHQTWSYRCDSPNFKGWNIDQDEMYKRLTAACTNLAKKYNLRVIPVGCAVQNFRAAVPNKYVPPTPEQLAAMTKPNLPDQSGDVVGNSSWRSNKKTGKDMIGSDFIHLNYRGSYLQGCVWYGFLFDEDPEKIQYTPKGVSPEQATLIRTSAAKALREFPQVKTK